MTIDQIIHYATIVVTAASVVQVGLDWAQGMLKIWVPYNEASPNRFWRFYVKLVQSVEYISLSRGAWGRKPEKAPAGAETPKTV